MKTILVSVRDAAVNAYVNIFSVRSTGEAIRSFADEVNNNTSALNKHPEHYEIFAIGNWDQQTGVITPIVPPESIATALSLQIKS